MTVVITGSSGFIGKTLVRYLLEKNYKLILLARGGNKIPADKNLHVLNYTSSLTDENLQKRLKEFSPEVFIHLAWKGTTRAERDQDSLFNYNVSLSVESVLLAHSAGCRHWIGTGSQAEYGLHDRSIFETDETNPVTDYGKAKLLAGKMSLEMCRKLNITGTWNRIFSVFGPEDNEQYFIPYIINSFKSSVKPLLTKCEQEWDYLFVEDFAEAIYKQIISRADGIFNVCSGTAVPLKTVVEIIQTIFPSKSEVSFGAVPYSENQVMHLSGNCDKLKNMCGWSPKTSLKEGIAKTINYYLHESV